MWSHVSGSNPEAPNQNQSNWKYLRSDDQKLSESQFSLLHSITTKRITKRKLKQNKKDGYRQQNVHQRQKLISIIDYDICMTFYYPPL